MCGERLGALRCDVCRCSLRTNVTTDGRNVRHVDKVVGRLQLQRHEDTLTGRPACLTSPFKKFLRQVLTSVHGSARGYPLLPTFGSLSVRARERGTSRKEHPLLERSHRDRLPRAFFSAMSRHLFACKSRAFQTEYLFPSPSADLEACRKKFRRRLKKNNQTKSTRPNKQRCLPHG